MHARGGVLNGRGVLNGGGESVREVVPLMSETELKEKLFEAMKSPLVETTTDGEPLQRVRVEGGSSGGLLESEGVCALEQAIQQNRDCCGGQGYQLLRRGALMAAEICSCLSQCPRCLGWGYRDGGSTSRSRPCVSPLPQRMVNLWNDSTLPVRYFDCELELFSNFTGNGQRVLSVLQNYLKNFSLQKEPQSYESMQRRGLVLSGAVGVGKTYLLVSLAKSFIRRGYGVKFIDFFQLITEIKAGFSQRASEEDILKPLIEVDVLFIDELGKGRNSEFELTILDQLVMGRYNQDKPILATTNYHFGKEAPSRMVDLRAPSHGFGLDSFSLLKERVGARIYSRIVEGCYLVPITGRDFRELQSEGREERL